MIPKKQPKNWYRYFLPLLKRMYKSVLTPAQIRIATRDAAKAIKEHIAMKVSKQKKRHLHVFSLEPLNKSTCACGRKYQDYMRWIRARGFHARARWAAK